MAALTRHVLGMGLVGRALVAVIYNVIAGIAGGVQVDIEIRL